MKLRQSTYLYIVLLLIACKSAKNIKHTGDNKTPCKVDKIEQIVKLKTYVKISDNGLYDFLRDSIIVPLRYDTITYKTKLGDVKNVRSSSVRALEYGRQIYHLLDSCDYDISVSDIIKHYHIPSTIGKTSYGDTISLFYYLNTKSHPDCRTPNNKNSSYARCSHFSFDFDENGYLNDLNGTFFYE